MQRYRYSARVRLLLRLSKLFVPSTVRDAPLPGRRKCFDPNHLMREGRRDDGSKGVNMQHRQKTVIAVKNIAAQGDLMIRAGAAGHVVDSSLFGTPRRVRFALHSDAGSQDITVDVRRGDVV